MIITNQKNRVKNEDDLKHDEFLDAFIKFVENKGWNFGGGSFQIDEEGNHIFDN